MVKYIGELKEKVEQMGINEKKIRDTADLIKAFAVAGIFLMIAFYIVMIIFFYGSLWIIAWSLLLLILKINVCNTGIQISIEDFIKRRLKITIEVK